MTSRTTRTVDDVRTSSCPRRRSPPVVYRMRSRRRGCVRLPIATDLSASVADRFQRPGQRTAWAWRSKTAPTPPPPPQSCRFTTVQPRNLRSGHGTTRGLLQHDLQPTTSAAAIRTSPGGLKSSRSRLRLVGCPLWWGRGWGNGVLAWPLSPATRMRERGGRLFTPLEIGKQLGSLDLIKSPSHPT